MSNGGGSERPTEQAQVYFDAVSVELNGYQRFQPTAKERLLFYGLIKMAEGLKHLSVGLRATYLQVEQLKRDIRRLEAEK